jgi:hypothetical protein
MTVFITFIEQVFGEDGQKIHTYDKIMNNPYNKVIYIYITLYASNLKRVKSHLCKICRTWC